MISLSIGSTRFIPPCYPVLDPLSQAYLVVQILYMPWNALTLLGKLAQLPCDWPLPPCLYWLAPFCHNPSFMLYSFWQYYPNEELFSDIHLHLFHSCLTLHSKQILCLESNSRTSSTQMRILWLKKTLLNFNHQASFLAVLLGRFAT